MNKTDLVKDLYRVLTESGWLDRATEHFRNHPEYYSKASLRGYIADITCSISYQPETLVNISTVKPNMFISMSGKDNKICFDVYDTGYIEQSTLIDYKTVSRLEVKDEI